MLKEQSANMNFSATSTIENNVIARFSANMNNSDQMYFNESIENYKLYTQNQEQVEADYNAFKTFVLNKAATLAI